MIEHSTRGAILLLYIVSDMNAAQVPYVLESGGHIDESTLQGWRDCHMHTTAGSEDHWYEWG